MSVNRQWRLVIIMILVGAIIAATLAVPVWIEQITGTTKPEVVSEEPFYTPTSEENVGASATNDVIAISPPTSTLPSLRTGPNNCTHDISYWLGHQASWPFEEIRIADQSYSKAEVVLIIGTETQDPAQSLLRQLFVYTLNIQYGADQSSISDIVVEAHKWVNSYPIGSVVIEQDQQRGNDLVHKLNEFNQGNLGPGLCPKDTATPTPTPTTIPTQTTTPTITPTPTSTNTSIVTLPPLFFTPFPEGGPKPVSTSEPREPEPEPTQPPPEPTEPPPEPTEPPPEPTEPPPEPTEPPPPPPEPTKVQLPTAAPTSEP